MEMQIKGIVDEDFVNYRKPSMFIAFPHCNFKCEKESGVCCCQNSCLANSPTISINDDELIKRYLDNKITNSIVLGGLEPFDGYQQLYLFISKLRYEYGCSDDVVIYTGYTEAECRSRCLLDELKTLSLFGDIIIKFGRYKPRSKSHYDEVLGVKLASKNQYAKRYKDGNDEN